MGRAAAGTGFIFIGAPFCPSLLRAAAAGRAGPGRAAAGRARRPARAGGRHRTARPPAPEPRRGSAAGQLLRGPRGRSGAASGCGLTAWAQSTRARRASRPSSGPECGILRGGERLESAKMALGLALRQGWWRSCSASAIFPGGAGGALDGRFVGLEAVRSGARGKPWSGCSVLYMGSGPEFRARRPPSLALPPRPDPKDEAAGSGREGAGAAGVLLLTTCVWRKMWAAALTLRVVVAFSEPALPAPLPRGQNWG